MATYYARKAGNINAADVWATTPSGTAAAVTFASGDVLISNSFAIAINVSTDLGSAGQIRNDNTGGATAGGSFTLSAGVTLTSNVFAGATATPCLNYSATGNVTVVGNITAGSAGSAHGFMPSHSSGTVFITGNITGGTANNAIGVHSTGTGNVSVTGNCVAQSGTAANNNSTGIMTITGNANGGTISSPCYGASNAGNGSLSLTGNVTGGSGTAGHGAINSGTNVLTVTGIATAGTNSTGINNSSTGRVNVGRAVANAFGLGNTAGVSSMAGVANPGNGIVEFSELEYGSLGQSPTSGTGFRLKKQSSNTVVFNLCDTAGAKTLVDATTGQMPAATDVRNGVSYASGALTGSAFIPSPATVATGVPVDNTVGTAALSANAVAAAVWGAATRTITGGTVDTLTNAPTVPSVVQIRQEMDANSTKLANLDATVSSRLSPSGTLATVTNLTNAPASVTPSDIWSHASRTITGGTVDTLTNAPSVPSAASIRVEIDSNSTQLAAIKSKTDNLPASPAATGDIPTESEIAAEVWAKPTTELTITGSIGERAKNQSTVSTTGAQLAAALS